MKNKTWLITSLFATGTLLFGAGCVNIAEVQKEAEAGNADSMRKLSRLYAKSDSYLFYQGEIKELPTDKEKSFYWLKKSAEAGNTKAMDELAWHYHEQKSYDEAMKWFDKAIDADPSKGKSYSYTNQLAEALLNEERLIFPYIPLYKKLSELSVVRVWRNSNGQSGTVDVPGMMKDRYEKSREALFFSSKTAIINNNDLSALEKYTKIKENSHKWYGSNDEDYLPFSWYNYGFRTWPELLKQAWNEFATKNYSWPGNHIPLGKSGIVTGMSYTMHEGIWDVDYSEIKQTLQTHLLKLMNGYEKVSQYIFPSTTKFQKTGTEEIGGVFYGKSFFVADKTAEEDINPFEFISLVAGGMKGTGTTFYFADITDQTDDLFALGMSKVYKDVPEKDIIEMLNKTYPNLNKVTKNNKRESRLILGTVYKVEYEEEPDTILENDKMRIVISKGKGAKLSDVKVTRLKEDDPAFKYALQISNALLNKEHNPRITKEVDFFTRREILVDKLEEQLKKQGKITSTPTAKSHSIYSAYDRNFKDYPLVNDYSGMEEMGAVLGYLDSGMAVLDSFSSTKQEIKVSIVDKKIAQMAVERANVIKAENDRIAAEKEQKEKQEKLSL